MAENLHIHINIIVRIKYKLYIFQEVTKEDHGMRHIMLLRDTTRTRRAQTVNVSCYAMLHMTLYDYIHINNTHIHVIIILTAVKLHVITTSNCNCVMYRSFHLYMYWYLVGNV